MAPPADAVVLAVPVPRFVDLLGTVADLDEEPGRGRRVEAEGPLVVVETQSVGEPEPRRPRAVERETHVIALVGLDLEVVEGLAEVEEMCIRDRPWTEE